MDGAVTRPHRQFVRSEQAFLQPGLRRRQRLRPAAGPDPQGGQGRGQRASGAVRVAGIHPVRPDGDGGLPLPRFDERIGAGGTVKVPALHQDCHAVLFRQPAPLVQGCLPIRGLRLLQQRSQFGKVGREKVCVP